MKLLLKSALLILLVGVLLGSGPSSWGELARSPWGEISTEMFPLSKPAKGGAIQVNLTIVLEGDCDSAKVMVRPDGDIVYGGQLEWYIANPTKGQVYTHILDVIVPPDDTSGLSVDILGPGWAGSACYFVTTGDTLEVHKGRPVSYPKGTGEGEFDGIRRGNIRAGEFPELDSLYGVPPTPPDTVYEKAMKMPALSRDELLMMKMKRFEESPLTDEESQTFFIGKDCYQRLKGETKFRKLEPITDLKEHAQKYQDSLEANPPDNDYDVIMDLRDTADYNLAVRLIDKMTPADSVGFYRAVIKRPILIELINNGIEYRRGDRPVFPKRNSTNPPDKSGESFFTPKIIFPVCSVRRQS